MLNTAAARILAERFGGDSLIALATAQNNMPFVLTVNAHYEGGAFYVITHARSGRMLPPAKYPSFAEWIDNGHNDLASPQCVILKITLTRGVLFSHGTRLDLDFAWRIPAGFCPRRGRFWRDFVRIFRPENRTHKGAPAQNGRERLCTFSGRGNQPFREPIMTPFSKYFCTKGYRSTMGAVDTTMMAYLRICWRFCICSSASGSSMAESKLA